MHACLFHVYWFFYVDNIANKGVFEVNDETASQSLTVVSKCCWFLVSCIYCLYPCAEAKSQPEDTVEDAGNSLDDRCEGKII